jgi:hypothetical protein
MYQSNPLLTHGTHELTSFDPSLECGDHDAFDTVCDNPGARISTKEKPTGNVLYYPREY